MNLYSHLQTGEDIPKPFNTCNLGRSAAKKTNFDDMIFLMFIFCIFR